MPRRSRIDAPGALHHIIARGIDRRRIFTDDADVKDLKALNKHPYCGHSCIVAQSSHGWQDVDYIHKLFASNKPEAIRGLLCFWATRELAISQVELGQKLKISQPTVSMAVRCGEQLASRKSYSLKD